MRLLSLTRPEGHLRVYLDAGEPMRQLLQSLLDPSLEQENGPASVPSAYIATLLAAFEQEAHKRAMQRETPPANMQKPTSRTLLPASRPGSVPEQPVLLEPLTDQERRVLHELAAGRSTQEIAQTLVVSPNTVKTHLRNLYGKLQVNSRTQALARARDLQLL